MKKGEVRPIAICVFSHHDSILVAEGYDSVMQEYYYRPIGGGIEFGETGFNTIIREVKEEIKADITEINYLGTIENIFTYNGDSGHEIVLVYVASFVDKTFYHLDFFEGVEDDGSVFTLFWKPVKDFQNGKLQLVPENLLNLLSKHTYKIELLE